MVNFSKKHFQQFTHHKKILKVTKFQFKINCLSRVLDKNIPLWYIAHPPSPTPVLIGLKCYLIANLILDSVWIVLVFFIVNFVHLELLDTWLWPELSYELGSLWPSILLSGSFLGIGSLAFFETQHGVRSICVVVHDSWIFFKKKFLSQKWENEPKIGILGFIGKFRH